MKKLLTILIKGYQMSLSPILKSLFGGGCRFTPTCSEYTIQMINKYGSIKGSYLGLIQLSKCHI